MRAQSTDTSKQRLLDETAIRAIPMRMIDAWNRGSGDEFAMPFTDTAQFVAFEGTHLNGRAEIAAFHRQLFETALRGTRLEGESRFASFVTPQLAVLHAVARVALAGRSRTSRSRDSMQLFVVRQEDGQWQAAALMNARIVTLEQQYFWGELESLPEADRAQVQQLVASRTRLPPGR